MKKYIHNGFLALFLLALGACQKPPAETKEQFFAFGSLVEINIYGMDEARARPILAGIGKEFDRMHKDWHPWQQGELGLLNGKIPDCKNHPVAPELAGLITRGAELSRLSGGLFNPAMGDLIRLWGFSDDPPKQTPPPDKEIKALLAANPVMQDVEMIGDTLRVTNPAVRLDFGALAQGYAVDWAVAELRRQGVRNAIINVSGDLRILGSHGERPWRIGIKNPRSKQGDILAALDVRDNESIVTSGDYERFYTYQGRRYHHIIDPRTGYPARGATSVTVLADDATTADAASTALLVAGPQQWYPLAKAMGLHGVMLVDEAGTVYMDPAMAKRLEFEVKPTKIVLSEPL